MKDVSTGENPPKACSHGVTEVNQNNCYKRAGFSLTCYTQLQHFTMWPRNPRRFCWTLGLKECVSQHPCKFPKCRAEVLQSQNSRDGRRKIHACCTGWLRNKKQLMLSRVSKLTWLKLCWEGLPSGFPGYSTGWRFSPCLLVQLTGQFCPPRLRSSQQ